MLQTLKQITCYDILPASQKLIVFDCALSVTKALSCLLQNGNPALLRFISGVQSAPIWDTSRQRFNGMLTVTDYIKLILHYYTNPPETLEQIEALRIMDLKRLTTVSLPGITSLHPQDSIFTAAHLLLRRKLHRLPLITSTHACVSVITPFKILRYITTRFEELYGVRECPIVLGVGTYKDIATATLMTPLIDILSLFMGHRLSSIPILDAEGKVIDVCEKYDILNLARESSYYDLDMKMSEALGRRSPSFEGIHSCRVNDTLGSILKTISLETVHRFVVVDSENRLKGVISLSDVLKYLVEL